MKYCFVLGLFVIVQTTSAATCTCTATSYPDAKEGEPATAVATNGSSPCNMNTDALNAHINSVIKRALANQPGKHDNLLSKQNIIFLTCSYKVLLPCIHTYSWQ